MQLPIVVKLLGYLANTNEQFRLLSNYFCLGSCLPQTMAMGV